jgi:pyruvate formate lyase activating enzyme
MNAPTAPPSGAPARFWHPDGDGGRIRCDLCPRACTLAPGQRAFCFVRGNLDGEMVLSAYGQASGFCIDPIEKKPLNHFYPGSSVLSFGTAGCNLGCRFCQNWDISKAKDLDRLSARATPEMIAQAAVDHGCKSVAFTYNDPVIFAEWAIDVAAACHERGVKTVAVTAGYITDVARPELYAAMDAANVDLKAFTEEFYKKQCFAELEPVKETLRWLVHESNVWTEVTTLLIPGLNDGEDEVARLADWFARELGPEVPLHLTAFHPDYKLDDRPPTPPSTLRRARQQALAAGLKHVYTGNIHDVQGQGTACVGCGAMLVERDGYRLLGWSLTDDGACRACGHRLAGRFAGAPGRWGSRRMAVVP